MRDPCAWRVARGAWCVAGGAWRVALASSAGILARGVCAVHLTLELGLPGFILIAPLRRRSPPAEYALKVGFWAKVEEQTYFEIERGEIVHELELVRVHQLVCGFDLDDDGTLYEDVQAMRTELMSASRL